MRLFVSAALGAATVGAALVYFAQPVEPQPARTWAELSVALAEIGALMPSEPSPVTQQDLRVCGTYHGEVEPVATLVAKPRQWSMAVVREYAGGPSKVVSLGHRVGGHALIDIQRGRLVFERTGSSDSHRATSTRYECADLGAKPSTATAAPTAAAPKALDKAGLRGAIRYVGPRHYALQADALLGVLQNPRSLRGEGRAVAHYRNGKMLGIKLAALHGDGLGRAIGLRRGDVITAIDGQNLTSASVVLGLRDRISAGQQTQVEVLRRGRPVQIRVDIE